MILIFQEGELDVKINSKYRQIIKLCPLILFFLLTGTFLIFFGFNARFINENNVLIFAIFSYSISIYASLAITLSTIHASYYFLMPFATATNHYIEKTSVVSFKKTQFYMLIALLIMTIVFVSYILATSRYQMNIFDSLVFN